jgi:peptidoglycan/xylan/chitin deacetylase (PgdA/CDA1 family)
MTIPSALGDSPSEAGSAPKQCIVTTSWDDANPQDLRVAELLRSRGLAGTFYVPLRGYQSTETLCGADLRELCASGFEIGAHSVSHRTLRRLRSEELGLEVTDCKYTLQECLGLAVTMFCYPNGYYNREVVEAVRRAGYVGARTCRMLSIDNEINNFEMPTTIQAFPHSPSRYLRNVARAGNFPLIWLYLTKLRRVGSWVDLGKHMFDTMLERGGIWHLYGHSWEIEQLRLWRDLEAMLDHIANHPQVSYTTNGALLAALKERPSCQGTAVVPAR